jgi:diguanylate cyclase (GGDEF)-like protein
LARRDHASDQGQRDQGDQLDVRHGMGDKVLKHVARRLEQQMRKSDSIARIGGDEFIILLADINTINDAQVLLKRMLSAMKETIVIDGIDVNVGASIGATFYPDDVNKIDILIRHADSAMYRAKVMGRNRIMYYSPDGTFRESDDI